MRSFAVFTAAVACVATAAFAQEKGGRPQIPSPLKITVSGYHDGGEIPEKYTCAAKPPGGSPQIEWSGAPSGSTIRAPRRKYLRDTPSGTGCPRRK